MIPVRAAPEPRTFDEQVRQKGLKHLAEKGFPLNQPLPANPGLFAYWTNCLDDLYRAYEGTCAYLAVYFERATGTASVDHFIAKSKLAGKAYEWRNFRLTCRQMNTNKNNYDDVLDPFEIKPNWFHLELISGMIYPNPTLAPALITKVKDTIARLHLDDPMYREMRARHYAEFKRGDFTATFLKRNSPFVFTEAHRQELL